MGVFPMKAYRDLFTVTGRISEVVLVHVNSSSVAIGGLNGISVNPPTASAYLFVSTYPAGDGLALLRFPSVGQL
jgi:hypothetical protein